MEKTRVFSEIEKSAERFLTQYDQTTLAIDFFLRHPEENSLDLKKLDRSLTFNQLQFGEWRDSLKMDEFDNEEISGLFSSVGALISTTHALYHELHGDIMALVQLADTPRPNKEFSALDKRVFGGIDPPGLVMVVKLLIQAVRDSAHYAANMLEVIDTVRQYQAKPKMPV